MCQVSPRRAGASIFRVFISALDRTCRRQRRDRARPSPRGCTPRRAPPRRAPRARARARDRRPRHVETPVRAAAVMAAVPSGGPNARFEGVSRIGPSRTKARRSPAAARSAATSAGAWTDAASASPPAIRAALATVERRAAEVDAVRVDRPRDVDSVVDVQPDPRRGGHGAQRAPELGQRAAGEVLFAELHGHLRRRQAAPGDARAARPPPRRSARARRSRAGR